MPTLLFIGDSITDCGRRESPHAPLGMGYVRLFADMAAIRHPHRQDITVLNRGISGNTVENLRSRWHDDVIAHRPDWVSVKIGINDLNQYLSNNGPLSPDEYEAIYRDLLTVTRGRLPETQLLLITPFYLSNDTEMDGSYRAKVLAVLPDYIAAVRRLTREFDARLLDLQALFQEQLKHHHPDRFCPEPVHPYLVGHLLMAEAVYDALKDVFAGA